MVSVDLDRVIVQQGGLGVSAISRKRALGRW